MITPLFCASLEELKKSLRLENVPLTVNGHKVFEDAVSSARAFIWQRLGQARIAQIQTTALKDNPSTDAEYLRMIAKDTEIKIVRVELAKVIPVVFKDGSNEILQQWNNEGAFREGNAFDIKELIDRMTYDVSVNMDLLSLEEEATETHDLQTMVIGPESPTRIGSVLPIYL